MIHDEWMLAIFAFAWLFFVVATIAVDLPKESRERLWNRACHEAFSDVHADGK